MSASDPEEVLSSGRAYRYLGTQFPNYLNGYPNTQVPDPLAIQIGAIPPGLAGTGDEYGHEYL